jgi:hypothetical protein
MDGAGADFFAGAGLAQDENRRIVTGHLPDQRNDFPDRGRGTGGEARATVIEGRDTRVAGICLAP